MRTNHSVREDHVHSLESRQLLSFNVFGPETVVPIDMGINGASTALAVAGDGSSIVAARQAGGDAGIQVVRYSAAGDQIGSPLNLGTPGEKADYLSASMDADGDAIIAYSTKSDDQDLNNVLEKVFVRRISRTGEVGAPVLIDSFRSDFDTRFAPIALNGLDVSMDEAGGFFVGWMPPFEVKVRAFDATDAPRGDTFSG